ncbi:ICMT-domain-containing protein [Suhomyces tanzawaensis NRRL Y-17324]|uniref:Protein-S-isoprenylcysteine O-methyltransferase n=1 Tax=Suhomyces tanzawaensis NRRL Y-17324 TaxID=984487 RepID=A0A1E4SHF3_9ASCO|nr:ICMT-domain-containing protein [Suhomyces tanzawaensis NRRL Y-17324]ODV78917.1 ICMT-domain-containing protein [Suhomyces tanzawaensis NRRL Y-17324]
MYDPHKNPLHEIVAVALALGAAMGISLTLLVVVNPPKYAPLVVVYGLVMPYYFLNEFMMTCLFQLSRVNSRSFLIYGNKGNFEFWMVQLLTVWEFLIKRSAWMKWLGVPEAHTGSTVAGMAMVVGGLAIRSLAMKTCGESFSHVIETEGPRGLITTGVYSVMRHPSYNGFWLFGIGIQVYLRNWVSLAGSLLILGKFFGVRIRVEEWYLRKMYGEQYEEYSNRVGIWIPRFG